MTKIMISVGEASGDLHGAALAQAIKRMAPDAELFGLGGQAMAAAGVEIVYDITDLGVMGLVEIVGNIPKLYRLRSTLSQIMDQRRPDALVVIDYFGFNLRLARTAKAKGIPVIYYIAPKIWAWGRGRARQVAAAADKVAAIFPFEVEMYQQAGADVTFVGHPLLDIARPTMARDEACRYFSADPGRPIVLLMPGSRRQEICSLLPVMLAAAEKIQEKQPDCQFFLPVASTISRQMVQNSISKAKIGVVLTTDHTYDLMSIADVAVAASGTATLETALLGTPTVIVYKVATLTYLAAKILVKIPFIGLPNIIAGRRIFPELLQDEATPDTVAAAALRFLQDTAARAAALADLEDMRSRLGGGGALERTAGAVLALCGKKT